MSALTEASAVTKCTEAVRNHPNTRGVPLGPFRGWCSQLFLEDAKFRSTIQEKNGHALADASCQAVEAYSAKKGKPWHRSGPKKDGKKADGKKGVGPQNGTKGGGPKAEHSGKDSGKRSQ